MIYDVSGNELSSAYELNGTSLSEAFDIDGEQIFPDSTGTLKVMTYNVQWFSDLNSNQSMQNKIISDYNADIIGFQEFSKTSSIPSVGQNVLTNYQITLSSAYNYLAMAYKYNINDIIDQAFTNQDTREQRRYMKCHIPFGDVSICWINTHLSVYDSAVRYAQMGEVLAMAEQEEYCIMTGDFNHYSNNTSSSDWINMYKPFLDGGYHIANCNNDNDFHWTYTNTSISNVLQAPNCPDNIITTGNIDIISTTYDMTKFQYVTTQNIDHIPVFCVLNIN